VSDALASGWEPVVSADARGRGFQADVVVILRPSGSKRLNRIVEDVARWGFT
jgi:hypothetical protein